MGFVLIAWLVELIAGLDSRSVHLGPVLAAVMACIPALFWLGFFYLLDRHEPEPKGLVVGVCVLGALIAAPLADVVLSLAAPPQALEAHSLPPERMIEAFTQGDRLLYAVLIAGLAQEMSKYAVVRYSIYMSDEFDEPMDGIVYMMACGTGFAVWLNYHRFSGQGHSVNLSNAAAQAVVTTLAHASFAGVLGFVMGRAKFSRRSNPMRALLVMLGLLGAAAFNGLFSVIETYFATGGMAHSPWDGVAYAATFATLVFAVIWFVAQRLLASSPFRRDA
ncbi:MAG: PrsW family glutamic-type intramembrane protease [Kofleriaceae bacterium]|nr:PrsW family glutamic-type intramembrane protease [Kofleriaceae bacterium]